MSRYVPLNNSILELKLCGSRYVISASVPACIIPFFLVLIYKFSGAGKGGGKELSHCCLWEDAKWKISSATVVGTFK